MRSPGRLDLRLGCLAAAVLGLSRVATRHLPERAPRAGRRRVRRSVVACPRPPHDVRHRADVTWLRPPGIGPPLRSPRLREGRNSTGRMLTRFPFAAMWTHSHQRRFGRSARRQGVALAAMSARPLPATPADRWAFRLCCRGWTIRGGRGDRQLSPNDACQFPEGFSTRPAVCARADSEQARSTRLASRWRCRRDAVPALLTGRAHFGEKTATSDRSVGTRHLDAHELASDLDPR